MFSNTVAHFFSSHMSKFCCHSVKNNNKSRAEDEQKLFLDWKNIFIKARTAAAAMLLQRSDSFSTLRFLGESNIEERNSTQS